VALTANAISGVKEMFLAKGLSDFISKPIDPLKLEEMLFKWIPREKLVRHFQQVVNPAISAAPAMEVPAEAAQAGLFEPVAEGPRDGGEEYEDEDPLEAALLNYDLPGVNIAEGVERLAGDASLYLEVVEAFTGYTPKALDQVRRPPEAANLKDYAVVVHGIKGSCYNIGAREVGRLAEIQEHAAKGGKLEDVMAGHQNFLESADKLIAAFNGLIEMAETVESGGEDRSDEDQDESELPAYPPLEALIDIYKASCNFDIKAMDELIAGLEAQRYKFGAELVSWLRRQIDNLEFDNISRRLSAELNLSSG
jgi:HPt (histidine-containing phosphotransfer) domain-containing protein